VNPPRYKDIARIAGTSMSPTLSPGQLVEVLPDKAPSIGSVVLIKLKDASYMIHRIAARISLHRTWYIHLGDASYLPGIVREDQIVGILNIPVKMPRLPLPLRIWILCIQVGAILVSLGLNPNRGTKGLLNKVLQSWMCRIILRNTAGTKRLSTPKPSPT
jgi:hypothetical protein